MFLINDCEYIMSFPHTNTRKSLHVLSYLRESCLQTFLEQPWTSSKGSKTQLFLYFREAQLF